MRDTPCPKHERQRQEIAAAVAAFERKRGTVMTSPAGKSASPEPGDWKSTNGFFFPPKEPASPARKRPRTKTRPAAKVKRGADSIKTLQAKGVKQRACEITEILERLKAKEADDARKKK